MIKIRRTSDCCGCSACAQKCPCGAIQMRADSRGFEYPSVNSAKCVECGLCEIVCPIWKSGFPRLPLHVYAVKHKDLELRKASASGGAFSLFAMDTLNRGGVVYGAAFDEKWDVSHVRISSADELWRLRGSKYVQSSLAGVFLQVKKDLSTGLRVLFSGLPCQIAALNLFLGNKREGLTTVELVCGGISSPQVWRDCLNEECKRLRISKGQITKVNFRDKTNGWIQFSHSIGYIDSLGKKCVSISSSYWRDCKNVYMRLYLHSHNIRPSCFSCRFKKGRSGADYAIADFWGIENTHKKFFEDSGVSLLLQYRRNDDMGKLLSGAYCIETSYEDGVCGNPAIERCSHSNDNHAASCFLHNCLRLSCRRSVIIADWYVVVRNRCRFWLNRGKAFVKRNVKRILGAGR